MATDRPTTTANLSPSSSLSIPISTSTSPASTSTHTRQSTLSLPHRLLSISRDSTYISHIHTHLRPLPLLANLRCGLWYIPPAILSGCAYFKSTDGHFGQWAFSLRRLNLNVLEVAGREGGCVIVDSARKGKGWPDSLSKTVPVWCAVMNRLLFPEDEGRWGLRTPEDGIVSASERAQMEGRIEGFVRKVKELDLDVQRLRNMVKKPLYPIWLPRAGMDFSSINTPAPPADVIPIYLCTASTTSDPSSDYIQGAGDDAESWAHGLTPAIFWAHQELLLRTGEAELPDLIATLVAQEKAVANKVEGPGMTSVTRNGKVCVGGIRDALLVGKEEQGILVVICALEVDEAVQARLGARLLQLKCGAKKLGSRDLRKELSKLPMFVDAWRKRGWIERMCICCASGTDLAVCVALVVVCLYGHQLDSLSTQLAEPPCMDKALIRKKLSAVLSAFPTANPSRTTLNTVNGFLMKQPT